MILVEMIEIINMHFSILTSRETKTQLRAVKALHSARAWLRSEVPSLPKLLRRDVHHNNYLCYYDDGYYCNCFGYSCSDC